MPLEMNNSVNINTFKRNVKVFLLNQHLGEYYGSMSHSVLALNY